MKLKDRLTRSYRRNITALVDLVNIYRRLPKDWQIIVWMYVVAILLSGIIVGTLLSKAIIEATIGLR